MEHIAYSPDRAAEILGIGRSNLYALIADGRLDARKLGRRTLVTRESLVRLVEGAPKADIRKAAA